MPPRKSRSHKKSRIIGSVQRALNILDLFDSQRTELGPTEMATALELPKSTVAGLILTLQANGYLDQNPDNRKYRLGLKLLERGKMLLEHLDVRRVALPHLEELRNWCNETVNLAVIEDKEVVYIERLLGTSTFGIHSDIGRREPIHSTALGKAILAFLPPERVAEVLDQYPFSARTPRTITGLQEFLRDLQVCRARGYALDDEENEIGGRCIAAPVINHLGDSVASVSISIPISRFPASEIPQYGRRVSQVSGVISRELGYADQIMDD